MTAASSQSSAHLSVQLCMGVLLSIVISMYSVPIGTTEPLPLLMTGLIAPLLVTGVMTILLWGVSKALRSLRPAGVKFTRADFGMEMFSIIGTLFALSFTPAPAQADRVLVPLFQVSSVLGAIMIVLGCVSFMLHSRSAEA